MPRFVSALGRRRPLPTLSWRAVLRHLSDRLALRRERLRLGRLDPHLLRDIGLSAEAAAAEAGRPIWDVPDHWRQ
ncbi:DUF1127 domain-containing protein [Rhodobacter sp. Har01]|uniref:DUF1127 domain-containing protein n=1 Tax=Rhodobacter sp. Har01 TaxID=2883999 RepID=UPI001D06FA26|nr:DUF1127 domain-containing protein [Rhodobacter sp. Har01]MCB6178159.1 DUF1127 domain-containing protein [Rhodobacter sp. Har01]